MHINKMACGAQYLESADTDRSACCAVDVCFPETVWIEASCSSFVSPLVPNACIEMFKFVTPQNVGRSLCNIPPGSAQFR